MPFILQPLLPFYLLPACPTAPLLVSHTAPPHPTQPSLQLSCHLPTFPLHLPYPPPPLTCLPPPHYTFATTHSHRAHHTATHVPRLFGLLRCRLRCFFLPGLRFGCTCRFTLTSRLPVVTAGRYSVSLPGHAAHLPLYARTPRYAHRCVRTCATIFYQNLRFLDASHFNTYLFVTTHSLTALLVRAEPLY